MFSFGVHHNNEFIDERFTKKGILIYSYYYCHINVSTLQAGESTAELKSMYDEELNVARDAISNLRTSFK